MSRRFLVLALVAGVATVALAVPGQALAKNRSAKPADTILTNARICTVNESQPWAKVVAIRGEKIVYVGSGSNTAWRRFVGPETDVVNVHGRLVLPGMVDSHTHPASVAMSSWHVIMPWTYDTTVMLEFVAQYAAEHPVSEVPFIYAEYYPSDLFDTNGPNKAMIDAYVSDRPVLLEDFSDHACWVNSQMLELMGVDKNLPDPVNPDDPAAVFVRDAEGNPTGWVLEGAWRYLADTMYAAIGWWPPANVTPELLYNFTSFLSSKGETAVWDAGGREATFASAAALEAQGKLNMNYYGSKRFYTVADLPENIAILRDWEAKYGSNHVHLDAMKFFLDGTNEFGTSAVLEPFIVGENDYGELRMSEDDLTTCMLMLNDEDLDLHIHLVGDRAFRVACNAVERARAELGEAWRIQVTLTHDELIDPADMPRVAELGIILNWTPHWSGGYFGTMSADWLGYERFDRMYQFNPIIASGGIVDYGSDVVSQYEAARADPFFGMQVGHTRVDPEYPMQPGPGTVPLTYMREPASACLSLEDLVEGYTLNGAIQLRMADQAGSIEVGKLANMALLNMDLFSVPDYEIQNVEPEAVIFEGKVVHGTLMLP